MIQLVQVSIENEMDLALAYKKSIKAAAMLGLSVTTQTTFATAVSEVCREVIDKAENGLVSLQVHAEGDRFNLVVQISYMEVAGMGSLSGGFEYARKLVPIFSSHSVNGLENVEMKITIPRVTKLNRSTIHEVKLFFEQVDPESPYEEVKKENMKLYKEAERSELALKHAEYLIDKKNEFLSIASHELKTPLTILRAFTQMALRSDCSPETLSNLKKVDIQAQKIQTMMQQLLDIAKVNDDDVFYNLEELSFREYLVSLEDLLKQLVPYHQLKVTMTGNAIVKIDKLRIEQVFTNIVGNAAKYSAKGTTIEVNAVVSGGEIQIVITDEGIGMPASEVDKIFDKFYRVEEVSKSINGLGMGLYIASKIVVGHGGRIWVESAEGKGSNFCFTIPVILS